MAKYIPSTSDWVREQVELYEGSGGTAGTTLRDTGLPVIIVTNRGNRTGGIRKTPLMRVKDGDNYVLVGSKGGAPDAPGGWSRTICLPGRPCTSTFAVGPWMERGNESMRRYAPASERPKVEILLPAQRS